MSRFRGLEIPHQPDWRGLIDNLRRKGTPQRVYNIEFLMDPEIQDAIWQRFDLASDINRGDPDFDRRKCIAVQRFCGFDYVRVAMTGVAFPTCLDTTADAGELARPAGRSFQNMHRGFIASWEDFEKYDWPDPALAEATKDFEWYQQNLPEDMCIIGRVCKLGEHLKALMGYEPLCYALFEKRDLVRAICDRLRRFYTACLRRILEFDRVKIIWAADDLGFKTGLLYPPQDIREFILPGHRELANLCHQAGRPYLLHCCGKVDQIIDDLIDDVGIDGKHSFEDTIEDVRQVKHTYGQRIALLGGIDVDFLCRSNEQAIRKRVRDTLDICLAGGGYCLGTGNSVANYIPLDNYLTMLDEGRLYCA